MKRKFLLQHYRALGDVALMTALPRDIYRAYGDQVQIGVDTSRPELWQNNPYIKPLSPRDPGVRVHELVYRPYIAEAKHTPLHFLTAFHRIFEKLSGLPVPVTEPRPDLHLTPQERDEPLVRGRYWVLMAGGKRDVTIKHWYFPFYQEVVDRLLAHGIQCVQSGAVGSHHVHPPLRGVLNLVGYGEARTLIRLIQHADGVIGPITGAMHLAAGLQRPCVVIAGGREEPHWEAYVDASTFGPQCAPVRVPHRYLHTMGLLECCTHKGCWRNRVVPLEARDHLPSRVDTICRNTVNLPQQIMPACMAMITPTHVVQAVMDYYLNGLLPPIQPQPAEPTAPNPPPAPPPLELLDKTTPQRPQPAAQQVAPVVAFPNPRPTGSSSKMMDHPLVGGKITICVIAYGDNLRLTQGCLQSILGTVPVERMDLRIGVNQPGPAVREYLRTMPARKIYWHEDNRKKYPVMREMFHDPDCPIETPYVTWFDDDTRVVDAKWLELLAACIVENHPRGARLYGDRRFHRLGMYHSDTHDPREWFRQKPWFRGRPFQTKSGSESPNGDCIHFVVGWWWAVATEAIREADLPCASLNHNGGDCTLGAQIYQAGFRIAEFNKNKSLIWTPPNGRRGYSETFPWSSPAGCVPQTAG